MLTYDLKKGPGVPLYEALYRCIRADILAGRLLPGEKLPSKRALAQQLQVSKITVEAAYEQLAAEGYILSRQKVGYFVEAVQSPLPEQAAPRSPLLSEGTSGWLPPSFSGPCPEKSTPLVNVGGKMASSGASGQPTCNCRGQELLDLTSNAPAKFPFTVWSRLQRQVLSELGSHLLEPVPHQGILELRQAISAHLSGFRGMQVAPENIIIGAGTDFLYNLVLQLLGTDKLYALEEPGYGKIRRIYQAGGARTLDAQMDESGVLPASLAGAQVLHVSVNHHFPSGRVTSLKRRLELLGWAHNSGGYLIEDDYDSEFRFDAHPQASLYGPDRPVIYINSFSKTLAPSIRMGYMVLPDGLMEAFRSKLGFYGCTVSGFEQHTLARFLSQGHFEKHINRMRKFYKLQRNQLLDILKQSPWAGRLTVEEADAGLHFIIKVDTQLSDAQLEAFCQGLGLRVRCLSNYYHGPVPPESLHKLVINYSSLTEADLYGLCL